MISKTVEDNETGKAFGLISGAEMVANFLGTLMLTSIYAALLEYGTWMVWIIDAALWVCVLPLTCAIKCCCVVGEVQNGEERGIIFIEDDRSYTNYGETE